MNRFLAIAALATLSYGCSPSGPAPGDGGTGHAIYMKDGTSDAQTIRDLNECARESFAASVDSGSSVSSNEVLIKKKCMMSKGYQAFYN